VGRASGGDTCYDAVMATLFTSVQVARLDCGHETWRRSDHGRKETVHKSSSLRRLEGILTAAVQAFVFCVHNAQLMFRLRSLSAMPLPAP
jgi:hypothetical protein